MAKPPSYNRRLRGPTLVRGRTTARVSPTNDATPTLRPMKDRVIRTKPRAEVPVEQPVTVSDPPSVLPEPPAEPEQEQEPETDNESDAGVDEHPVVPEDSD